MTVVTGHDPHRDGRQNDGDRRDPVWQPVSRVGPMTEMVAGQVEHSRHMYELLERARPAHRGAVPEQVLDDATVSRTVEVYGRMAGDYRAEFAEQARRWQRQQGLDARTREQVEAFAARVDGHLVLLNELLALGEELRAHTIEAILARDDAELGLEHLAGQLREHGQHPHPDR